MVTFANRKHEPSGDDLGVKVAIDMIRQDMSGMEHGQHWYLHGLITTHQTLLVPALEEGRHDDAKIAATYIMAAAAVLLKEL